MSLLNTITTAITENPVVSLAALAGVRIIAKDIGRTKTFIAEHMPWDGKTDRRGPNRAKNVVRPAFGVSKLPVETVEEVRRTGTKG